MTLRAQICATLAAFAALALPSVAAANALDIPAAVPPKFRALVRARLHRPPPLRHGFESRLDLKAQHGYEISVIGEGAIVAVQVTRPSHGKKSPLEKLFGLDQAVTAYVARGTVTPHRIAASFGKFGEVDVRFRPSGQVIESKPRRHCKGADHFSSQLGVFVGSVRFSGEKHYVAVRSQRAKGRIRRPLHLRCNSFSFYRPSNSRARPVPQQPSFAFTFLGAGWRHAVSATELIALRGGKKTLFLGVSEESLGSMAKIRYALAFSSSKEAFALNNALTSATVKAPAPFHGKGTYHAAPDGTTSWTGSLSVSFPGAPRLPLAGEEFKATLESGF